MGRALTLDLDGYLASRQDALILLRTALPASGEPDYSALFHATESYRAGADGQEKTINLLRALGSLIEDLLLIVAGTPQLIRNLDIEAELARLAQGLSVDWIDSAAHALVQVEQGMRRNLLRSLSLDAMAVSLGQKLVNTFLRRTSIYDHRTHSAPQTHPGVYSQPPGRPRSTSACLATATPKIRKTSLPSAMPSSSTCKSRFRRRPPWSSCSKTGNRSKAASSGTTATSLKVRGRQKTLVYKSAIKYMYKVGDQGQGSGVRDQGSGIRGSAKTARILLNPANSLDPAKRS